MKTTILNVLECYVKKYSQKEFIDKIYEERNDRPL